LRCGPWSATTLAILEPVTTPHVTSRTTIGGEPFTSLQARRGNDHLAHFGLSSDGWGSVSTKSEPDVDGGDLTLKMAAVEAAARLM
jgi:hypothetical protein